MMQSRRLLAIIIILFVVLGIGIVPGRAANPLPPLPSQAVVNQVITQTNGPTFTPLGRPQFLTFTLGAFTQGAFAGVAARIDLQNTVSYIDLNHTIQSTFMPMLGAASSSLHFDIVTPDDGLPAQIVGALFDKSQRTMLAVLVWKDNKPNKTPKELRLYSSTGGQLFYALYKVKVRDYKAKGGSSQPPPSDAGALITNAEGCFVIGLNQICVDTGLADGNVQSLTTQAYQNLSHVYSFNASFDFSSSVPDLLGATQRSACAAALAAATGRIVSGCTANAVFTNAQGYAAGQPIALLHVIADADLKAYDPNGNYVGHLPPGDYLVIDVTPANVQNTPGAVGALFLVNADQSHHYVIPSRVMQDLGISSDGSDDNSNLGQAAVKDGMATWRGF